MIGDSVKMMQLKNNKNGGTEQQQGAYLGESGSGKERLRGSA